MISILQIYTQSEEEAVAMVRKGEAWGSLYFSANFSKGVFERLLPNSIETEGPHFNYSTVDIKLDMSSELKVKL